MKRRVTTGLVLVAGEISAKGCVDIPKIVRSTIEEIGYSRAKYGFDAQTCAVLTAIDEQSSDIAQAVNESLEKRSGQVEADEGEIGAGDQGMVFDSLVMKHRMMPITLFHWLIV